MRVTFNSLQQDSLRHITRQANRQAELQTQISSGQKISRADQDPTSAQRILSMQVSSEQAQQYYKNGGTALNISNATFAGVGELRKVSDRVGEITSRISGVTPAESFGPYAREVDELLEHSVASLAQRYDNKYLFGGTKTDVEPFNVARDASGKVTSVTYTGAAKGASLQVSENMSVTPFTDGATNAEFGNFINNLVALRDAIQSGDSTAVQAQRPAMQASEDAILGSQARLGAQQRRFEISQEANTERYDELAGRLSAANDVDLPQAVVELTKSQTAYQGAIQSTAKILSQSLLDYL